MFDVDVDVHFIQNTAILITLGNTSTENKGLEVPNYAYGNIYHVEIPKVERYQNALHLPKPR